MTSRKKTWICALSGLATCLAAQALISGPGNPYESITDRNVFGLKPPTPVPTVAPPSLTQQSKITLTGITTILGSKRALLSAQVTARPPEPAKQEFYMLAEGQRDGSIEILAIDEKAGTVRLNNSGTVETLDFINNGAKLASVAAPVPSPRGGPPPQIGIPLPPGAPGTPGAPGNAGNMRSIPTKQSLATPGSPGAEGQANQSFATGEGGPMGAVVPLQFQNPVNPEEQTLMIETQRLYLQEQGQDEAANMFPITEITPGNELPF